jgi:hypothetical protein
MKTPDDDASLIQFESYLRQFQPIAAEPLHLASGSAVMPHWKAISFLGVAALVAILGIGFHSKETELANRPLTQTTSVEQLNAAPLTLRTANLLLRRSDSFKAAIDQVAFRHTIVKDARSALVELGKEKDKL